MLPAKPNAPPHRWGGGAKRRRGCAGGAALEVAAPGGCAAVAGREGVPFIGRWLLPIYGQLARSAGGAARRGCAGGARLLRRSRLHAIAPEPIEERPG